MSKEDQDCKALRDTLEWLEETAYTALMDCLVGRDQWVLKAHRDHRENVVLKVNLEHEDQQVHQERY